MNSKKNHPPLKVLYADDDTDDCVFFDKALTEIPIATQLTTVRDGEQLMKYLFENIEQLPDILFLDLSMPRKTGFECLAEIKENDKLKNIPVVVFTTSYGRGIDFEEGLANTLSMIGAQEYIRKPGNFEQLKKIIHTKLAEITKIKTLKKPGTESLLNTY